MTAGDVPANVSFNYQLPEVIAKVTGTQPGRHSRGISRESGKSPGRGFPTKSLGNDDISAVPAIFAITSINWQLEIGNFQFSMYPESPMPSSRGNGGFPGPCGLYTGGAA